MSSRADVLLGECTIMAAGIFSWELGSAAAAIVVTSVLCYLFLHGLESMLRLRDRRVGDECPRCRRGLIERIAVTSSGVRLYECNCCETRYTRSSRTGHWHDGSKPRYDQAGPSALGERDRWTATIDGLTASQRARHPSKSGARDRGPWTEAQTPASLWDLELDRGLPGFPGDRKAGSGCRSHRGDDA